MKMKLLMMGRIASGIPDRFRHYEIKGLMGFIGREVTGDFCTSESEREFTLEGSWYAHEEIQAGAGRDAVAAD